MESTDVEESNGEFGVRGCPGTRGLQGTKVAVNPLEQTIEFDGEWDPGPGEPADPAATPMGSGTISLEEGGTFTGDFYDTDGDGKPDKFKPDGGQGDLRDSGALQPDQNHPGREGCRRPQH